MCLPGVIIDKKLQANEINFENCSAQQYFKNPYRNPFQSSSLLPIRTFFCICCVIEIISVHRMLWPFPMHKFGQIRDKASLLRDWFKKLAPPSKPIRCETKANRDFAACVFPRLKSATYVCFEFVLVCNVAFVHCDCIL